MVPMNFKLHRYIALFVLWALFYSCSPKKQPQTVISYYFGQEIPDSIPEIYGKDVISVKGRFDMGFTISPNGKSMAFGVADESNPEETSIYLMNYSNGTWTSPDKSFLPDNRNTYFPMFAPSGNEFYFAKSDGSDTDLWRATFAGNRATNPQPLDSIFNSSSREAGHGKSKNGSFYFTSNRDDTNQCCGDIYYAQSTVSGDYLEVEKPGALSSEADEESLFLSPNEDYIIIQAWKNEFQSKHDLYISYRTKKGSWTVPKRLNPHINSEEIEQRPFISPDNEVLFFSRMSITHKGEQVIYDSDIFWVSTKSVFGPYVYNPQIKTSLKYGTEFELKLPNEIFKDVDDKKLNYQLNLADGSKIPTWITFDSKSLMLSGRWNTKQVLKLKLTATDLAGNSEEFEFPLKENDN